MPLRVFFRAVFRINLQLSVTDETKRIESWGTDATNRTRDEIAEKDLPANERNRLWWEALPMTYEDWEGGDRDAVSKEDFLRVDQHYFVTNPYLLSNVPFDALAGRAVLEIGCGAGSASCRFALAGAEVTAVDITDKAVVLTQRHAEWCGTANVRALQADAENLSMVPDASFDFLYSWGVMHHSAQPRRCFEQACAKLKPGGRGIIMVYHRDSLRYWLKGLLWLLVRGKVFTGDTFETVQRHYTDGYYHQHYTRASLTAAMTGAGFEVERIDVTHMSSRLVPLVPEFVRQWLKRRVGWLIVARVRRPAS